MHIDVWEPVKHAERRIGSAHLHPLSTFDAEAVRRAYPDRPLVFQCRSGKRSIDAALRTAKLGVPAMSLRGGIEAWPASGRSVITPEGAPRIGIMRQLQITAGSRVLIIVVVTMQGGPGYVYVPKIVEALEALNA